MMISRRDFLRGSAAAAAGGLLARPAAAIEPVKRNGTPSIKLACCAYSYRQYLQGAKKTMTLESFADRCAEMGLDGAELTSYYFPNPVTSEYLAALKRRCFLLGLDVSGTALGGATCQAPGPGREKYVAMVKEWIDRAADLGAPVMRLFAGSPPRGETEETGRKWVVECAQECCEHAAKRGVILALENHGGLTAKAEGTLAMVQAVNSEWFGMNLDTGNFGGADAYDQIEKCAPYAVTTHFKTSTGGAAADMPRIVAILRKAGYRGYLSLEYEAKEDPMTAVPRVLGEMRAAINAAAAG